MSQSKGGDSPHFVAYRYLDLAEARRCQARAAAVARQANAELHSVLTLIDLMPLLVLVGAKQTLACIHEMIVGSPDEDAPRILPLVLPHR